MKELHISEGKNKASIGTYHSRRSRGNYFEFKILISLRG
jgi:hypothetical protein